MTIFLILLISFATYFFLPDSCPEPAKRMAVIFMLAALFWALEVVPLCATSLLVVFLETIFLTKAGGTFGIPGNHYGIFLTPFSNPVIILFMGGFALAAALHKYGIDRFVAGWLLNHLGKRPYFVLLGFMAATAFLSMWMSNTATTAVMLTMILPLLSQMDKQDPFRKGLVLGIAFAASIGGVGTPVGTPPNAIAIGYLTEQGIFINFALWVIMVFPLVVLLVGVSSLLLFGFFPPANPKLVFRFQGSEKLSSQAKLVNGIALITILLWLSSPWHKIPEAIVAVFSMAFLIASGLLDRTDFKGIDWDILVLMWGGLALGEGMETTGLAKWVVGLPFFAHEGFLLVLVFCGLSFVLSTFMSNTATVNLLVPLAISLPHVDPVLSVVVIALASSFDIPLPIATPPMAMAYGTGEVRVKDMLKVGLPFAVAANLIVLVGVKWMVENVLGFAK